MRGELFTVNAQASEAASRVPVRADGSCASPELLGVIVGIWNACVICNRVKANPRGHVGDKIPSSAVLETLPACVLLPSGPFAAPAHLSILFFFIQGSIGQLSVIRSGHVARTLMHPRAERGTQRVTKGFRKTRRTVCVCSKTPILLHQAVVFCTKASIFGRET
jgi:hypothetical protein